MTHKQREKLRRVWAETMEALKEDLLRSTPGADYVRATVETIPALLADSEAHERWEAMARELAVALEGVLITHCGTNARDDAERNAGFVLAKFRARAKETP